MLLASACGTSSRIAWRHASPVAGRRPKLRARAMLLPSRRPASSQLGLATREDEEPEEDEGDTRVDGPDAPPYPPPKPLAPHITLYADSSFPSKLSHSLLTEVSLARRPVRPADLAAKSALKQASSRLGVFLTRRVDNPFPLPMKYERVDGRGPEGEELSRWRAIRREEDEARSLRGAPSALLLHPDEASPAHPSAPPGPSATTDVAPASRAQAGAAPAQPQLPLCVNWTTRETFQGPYMFSGVEKMVKSMRAAQEKRFEAERTYDAYLKQKGYQRPARDQPVTDRVRWWEVAFFVAFVGAVEWQLDLLGLRTRVDRERQKWGLAP